jgi:hypothetical protein
MVSAIRVAADTPVLMPDDSWVWTFATRTLALLALGPEGGDCPAWTADSGRIAEPVQACPRVCDTVRGHFDA